MKNDFENYVHPTAILNNVTMGKGNYVGPYCLLQNCEIGNNNRFEAFCSIGTPPEHKQADEEHPVLIGDNNFFKEFITVNCGASGNTIIGNGVWMLAKSHVGHDSIIGDNVTISCFVPVGGHSEIAEYTNLGLHTVLHQFSKIPPGTMVGMGGVVTKQSRLEPFKVYAGNPVKYLKENNHLENNGILSVEEINNLIELWNKNLQ